MVEARGSHDPAKGDMIHLRREVMTKEECCSRQMRTASNEQEGTAASAQHYHARSGAMGAQ